VRPPAAGRAAAALRQASNSSNGTHVITEGVKSALAQIAASTIHHHDEPAPLEEAPVAVAVAERAKKPRKKRPEPAPKPKTEKDLLLDSVLSALPEPKAPWPGPLTPARDDGCSDRHPVRARPERGLTAARRAVSRPARRSRAVTRSPDAMSLDELVPVDRARHRPRRAARALVGTS
jgi:hypothetical protein